MLKLHKKNKRPKNHSRTKDEINDQALSLPSDHLMKDKSRLHDTISTIIVILLAPAIALILTFFVFQQYEVDGPSMMPTLQNGNRLIVLKLAKTWSKITNHPYIPSRGDIVIFQENNLYNLSSNGTNQLIKRVIGLPGDHVVIQNGIVNIYNSAHPNGFDPDKTLPYGKIIGYTSGDINIIVPSNQIFVCGDNRGDSLDSRVFGTVPVKDIIGKLAIRITPLSEYRTF